LFNDQESGTDQEFVALYNLRLPMFKGRGNSPCSTPPGKLRSHACSSINKQSKYEVEYISSSARFRHRLLTNVKSNVLNKAIPRTGHSFVQFFFLLPWNEAQFKTCYSGEIKDVKYIAEGIGLVRQRLD
jgi:hypothetical protein